MTTTDAVQLARQAMLVALLLAAPMLGFGLLVGLFVSVIQAVTQVNEMTLTFIPKIIAVMLALAIFMPWTIRVIVEFTIELFMKLPNP
ncbi:MAG: flagellar biosynthesis protein FliQ [Candidatus Latescibacteria bacterium]|jgi:flagellar biosynthesis protein FliQ|nr:flagellar biosynthesis protein FliQ [Candidatus Latescibacterota bacterium]